MWREIGGILLAVIVTSWIVSYAIRRPFPELATNLQFGAAFIGRAVVSVIFASIALRTAERGGWWVGLTVFFGVLAAVGFGFNAVLLFALMHGRSAE